MLKEKGGEGKGLHTTTLWCLRGKGYSLWYNNFNGRVGSVSRVDEVQGAVGGEGTLPCGVPYGPLGLPTVVVQRKIDGHIEHVARSELLAPIQLNLEGLTSYATSKRFLEGS